MKKKLINSLNKNILNYSNNSKSIKLITNEYSLYKSNNDKGKDFVKNSIKVGENIKYKSLKISSEKNTIINYGNSIKERRNYKYNLIELKKGNRIFNKIMSTDRKGHILRILDSFDREHVEIGKNIPLDLHLRKYFLKFKFVKSEDREFIYDQVFNLIRFKGLIDFLTKPPLNWFSRFDIFFDSNFEIQKKNVNIPA